MEPSNRYILKSAVRAFSLIEMIVVLAIIGMVMSVVLLGHANFNKTVLLNDVAYTIALSLRQMQSYGLSSIYFKGYSNAGFGVHFDLATPSQYENYADIEGTPPSLLTSQCPAVTSGTPEVKPGNCRYDDTSEDLRTFTLNGQYTIKDLCGTYNGTPYCSVSSSCTTAKLDITYIRPNTQAIIVGTCNGSTYPLSAGCVKIQSREGTTKTVQFTELGQVFVSTVCP
jgi:prepilin-type N-terminal cleavage/methylation domain-containing protein